MTDTTLDDAWKAAEAALPEGWHFEVSKGPGLASTYFAVAVSPYPEMRVESGHSFAGPVPALIALTEKLREQR